MLLSCGDCTCIGAVSPTINKAVLLVTLPFRYHTKSSRSWN